MKKIVLLFTILMSLTFANNNYVAKGIVLENGEIVEGENINIKHPLASVTKLMSAVVTLEAVEKGEVSLEDIVTIDSESSRVGGSFISLKVGEKISLRDLLYASMIHSANNATYAMAKHVSGTYEEFVVRMNEKAKELEMNDTVFYTPAGLPSSMTGEETDMGTLADIAKLSLHAIENEELMKITSMKEVVIKKGSLRIENRNKNLKIDGVDGLKTGHTDDAMYNITVSVDRDGNRVLVIVFGSPTEAIRDKEVEKNIEYAYAQYNEEYLINKGDFLVEVPVNGGKKSKINLYAEEDIQEFIKKDWKLTRSLYLPKEVKAPLKKGEVVGVYIISNEGKEIGRVNLVTEEDMDKSNVVDEVIKKIKD